MREDVMQNNLKRSNRWAYGIGVFTLIFLLISVLFQLLDIQELPAQVSGVLFEVVVTAIITVLLLNGQSATEEERDKSLRVFEKKQEVYHHFLENFKKIICDGKIVIQIGENHEENIDELKELLFELGYIQLHTSEENTREIFAEVAEIIKLLNYFESEGERQQQQLPQFYAQLSQHLFKIISILKADLYGKDAKTIETETVKGLLESCDLFVQNGEFDKYALQNNFWEHLQDRLLAKGYQFERFDFKQEVSQYYARARNRYRYYGLEFPIYTLNDGQPLMFRIEVGNVLYYGFFSEHEKEDMPILLEAAQEANFSLNTYWCGFKYFDRNELDFWRLNSEAFERLNHPLKRDRLMDEIADELDGYIKRLQQYIQQNEDV